MKDLLDPPEHGLHSWLYGRALYLRKRGMEAPEAVRMIEDKVRTTATRRAIPGKEIADAVGAVFRERIESTYNPPPKHKPEFCREQAKEIGETGPDLVDLWEMSELRFDEEPQNPGFFLEELFRPDDLICVARRFDEAGEVKSLEEWRGIDLTHHQFVVPNPMTSRWGITQDGRSSTRTKANSTHYKNRRYLVVEIDKIEDEDEQAGVIFWLSRKADLWLVLHSGGKSLHAWFHVGAMPFPQVQRFARLAVSLGADPAAFRTSQLVRLPDGTRDNGRRQHIIYFKSK